MSAMKSVSSGLAEASVAFDSLKVKVRISWDVLVVSVESERNLSCDVPCSG
jgi:hypothetical protein